MVVRMRHTRGHTANRRSHHALKNPTLSVCKNCGGMYRPHHMCLNCGFYKGRVVIDLLAKKKARETRLKEKRDQIRGDSAEAPTAT
jgi:large subunit ribosomal protein L32